MLIEVSRKQAHLPSRMLICRPADPLIRCAGKEEIENYIFLRKKPVKEALPFNVSTAAFGGANEVAATRGGALNTMIVSKSVV
jgi:hypothetical protein